MTNLKVVLRIKGDWKLEYVKNKGKNRVKSGKSIIFNIFFYNLRGKFHQIYLIATNVHVLKLFTSLASQKKCKD